MLISLSFSEIKLNQYPGFEKPEYAETQAEIHLKCDTFVSITVSITTYQVDKGKSSRMINPAVNQLNCIHFQLLS